MTQSFVVAAQEAVVCARATKPVFHPAVAVAQAILESNYGRSQLARDANNLLGIKAGKSWVGPVIELPTREWDGTKYITVLAKWRKYLTYCECFVDYANIIDVLPWYADAKANADSIEKFLDGILANGEPGWATDPHYKAKILNIIDKHELDSSVLVAPKRIGPFDLWVDNAPTVGKAITMFFAALRKKPAVFREAINASATTGEKTKLDVDRRDHV